MSKTRMKASIGQLLDVTGVMVTDNKGMNEVLIRFFDQCSRPKI